MDIRLFELSFECVRGVRWNDLAFEIEWPLSDKRVVADKDIEFLDFIKPGNK